MTGNLNDQLRIFHAEADAETPVPVVLVLPGGGYRAHSPHEAEPVADWLNGLGLHACVLRYGTEPQGTRAPLDDARAAMRALRGGAAGETADSSRVAVLGFSAGGHLAAWLSGGWDAEGAERPDLTVLCYPVISFTHRPHLGSSRALLGADAPNAALREASLEYGVHPSTPPVFCWHTAADESVDVEHALRYTSALHRAGVPVELHVVPGGAHGLGLATGTPYVARWTSWCAEWFADHGWL
ncbi:alpha/beta hydrolase [Actinomadura opuntiae]|uniref:alpha/beta hydrolase n=1 Tax=Actinomadura sp. OS1-43 TaxID=604315 RepID=UPI00255ADAE3|nr:alpha/beta hydrolase [Actinomadura sp. OS1-43]MDL4821823.1 alpha/beta hydrolase [Actinomadura sp. OS1-43]